MRKISIAAAATSAIVLSLGAANAATLHFATQVTSGLYQNGGRGDTEPDTSAAFSFDLTFTSASTFDVSNGVFTDDHGDAYGNPEIATGFYATGVSVSANEIDLINTDGAALDLSVDPLFGTFPHVTGLYGYGGAEGETASGTFGAVLSSVPLPAAAPMLGGALALLGVVRFCAKRSFSRPVKRATNPVA